MSNRRALLSLAVLAVALPAVPARAYDIWIDLNTYVKDRQGNTAAVARTGAFAGADGVWLITDNAYGNRNNSANGWSGIDTGTGTGFSLSDWRTMTGNIAGPAARIATEDNPYYDYPGFGPHPDYQTYRDALSIIGTNNATQFRLADRFEYNETGSTAGGTVLSTAAGSGRTYQGTTYSTQVQTYAASHGGSIGYLTRGYTTGWTGPVEAAAADPLVSAGVMETVNLEGQNTAAWINSVTQPLYSGSTLVRPAKPAYVLLTTATYRNLPGLYYLKQYAPEAVASGMVRFVLNNDYSTTATAGDGTDGYGFFGPGDTVEGQQDLLNVLKSATPVESWQWKTAGTGNWSDRTKWSVTPNTGTESTFRATQPGPANKWDAAAFTSSSLSGNVTVNVNVASARAIAMYFDGPASYTINGTSAITLGSYGTVGADGRVPTVSGSIPTGPSTDATAYRANIVPIQVKGTGGQIINAPITLDPTNTAGLLIDNQVVPTSGYNLFLSGTLTTQGLPTFVSGVGNSSIDGTLVGGGAITMNGTGSFGLGGQTSNVGVTLTANAGYTNLSSFPGNYAAEAVLDIAAGATVRATTSLNNASLTPLNPAYAGANVTINSGGRFDVFGQKVSLTALAGTGGTVTNSGGSATPKDATLTVGLANQSGEFAGSLTNGSFYGSVVSTLTLAKTGTGTQTLSGPSTFSGGVIINAGQVVAANSSALGIGLVFVNGVGASAAAGAGTLMLAADVTVNNGLTLQGPRSDPSNSAAVPHVLNISGNNTLSSNLTLTAAGGLGVLVRSDAGILTLSGALTNNNNPGYARPYILYGNGNGQLTGTIANGTGQTAVTKQGPGTWAIPGVATYTGPTTVAGGTLRLGKNAFAPVLTNAGGADVQTGRLVFDYAGVATPAAAIRSLLAASAATGFTSTSARLRSTTATAARGLGYADNGTSVTVMATLYGDADLDGGVSINDFNALAANFGVSGGRVWTDGDFDYDGGVSINDFNLLAGNFGQSLAASAAGVDFAGLLAFAAAHDDLIAFERVTGVPEPAAAALLLAATALGRRRRGSPG